jgi:probable phosphoglycerate mutase
MTRIYLIRHAEAEGNIYRRAQGQYDSLVTTNGYLQLEALRARFHGEKIDAVYSSDLFRARETARVLAAPRGLSVRLKPELREIKMGAWEDRPWGELNRYSPEQMDLFNNHPDLLKVEGCESFSHLRARVLNALWEIIRAHPGETVAVTSHGMAIRALMSSILNLSCAEMGQIPHSDNTGSPYWRLRGNRTALPNCAITPFRRKISTFAQQRWWRDGNQKRDHNLWFLAMDPAKDHEFFSACHREAWQLIHGDLSSYDEGGFLRQAPRRRGSPRTLFFLPCCTTHPSGMLQLSPEEDGADSRGAYSVSLYSARIPLSESRRTAFGRGGQRVQKIKPRAPPAALRSGQLSGHSLLSQTRV